MNIDKSTMNDKRRMLSDAIDSGWVLDFDEEFIYFEQWDDIHERYVAFRRTYEISEGNVVTFGEEKEQVVATTEFKLVETGDTDTDKSISGIVQKALDKYFGGSKRQGIDVIKQFDSEGMYAIEPLYIAPGEVDGHGDTMDLEAITGMVDSLNKANEEGRLQSGLFHKHKTDAWKLDKAWVNPTECMIGDTLVPEGQPIAKTLFTNKAAYDLRVNGDICGLSIGGRARNAIDLTKGLSEIQSKPEATRQLEGVHFDWDYPELTYTSASQGGAASLKNEAYQLNKAKKAVESDLDQEQVQILKDIGESFISLEKHLGADKNQTPSSSAEARVGEDTQVNKGTDNMSENTVTREEFLELQKALAVEKAKNSIAGYAFEAELNKSVAGAIATLNAEDKEAIEKAFDALVARADEAVDKAKKGKPQEENELSKALSEEAGEGGEPEAPVEKSLAERAREAQDKIKGAK